MDNSSGLKPFPEVGDFAKLILAMLLPVIGPIMALVKGVSRAFGKNIIYTKPSIKYYYKPDARYNSGQRVVGSRTVNNKVYRLKSESPKEDVKRFDRNAYFYICIAIFGALMQVYAYNENKKSQEIERDRLASLAKWNNVTIAEESSGTTITYDMIYPVVDSTVVKDFIILKKEGEYYLLVKWSSDIDRSYIDKSASVELNTDNGIREITLKETITDYGSVEYLTPENTKEHFYSQLLFPKGVFPYKGIMQIGAKKKVYTYNME